MFPVRLALPEQQLPSTLRWFANALTTMANVSHSLELKPAFMAHSTSISPIGRACSNPTTLENLMATSSDALTLLSSGSYLLLPRTKRCGVCHRYDRKEQCLYEVKHALYVKLKIKLTIP